MRIPEPLRNSVRFAGMAIAVVLLGHIMMDIPGSGGVKSNFAELALMICIPFLPRWYHAVALSAFTVFNVPADGSVLAESGNHMISFPLVWLVYHRWRTIRSTSVFVLAWVATIGVYYFVGLIPLIFLIRMAMGTSTIQEGLLGIVAVSRMVVYEVLATAFLSIFYFLMIRELEMRKAAQSDLEQRNAELSRHRALLHAQYHATKEGIVVVGKDGRILSWNRRILELWRIDEAFLRGINVTSGNEEPDRRFPEFLEAIGATASDATGVIDDTLHLEGGRVFTRFSAPLVGVADGASDRVWFFHDVSDLERAQLERQQLQEQLFQSQKMEAVGQLAGGVAHDFNNALGVILGAAELTSLEPLDDEARSNIDMIIATARRSASLTRKLLSFSRKIARSMSPVDVASLVRETADLLRSSLDRSIAIHVRSEAERTRIQGDAGLLQNAFMNLGINASHAMADGGDLSFGLREVVLDQQTCDVSPFELVPGRFLEIEVRDTGTGIPPEHLLRIFEPFFTTKAEGKGTGLGLASVYGIVQEHRGAITVESMVGSGTVFRVYLPLEEDGSDLGSPSGASCGSLPGGDATILLIEDEEMLRRTTARSLENLGYTVIQAIDGEDALQRFQERRAEIHLVVMDMIMPRKGGLKVIQEIRAHSPDIPVIICSGWAERDDIEASRALGISAFLSKPYDRADLALAVANALS